MRTKSRSSKIAVSTLLLIGCSATPAPVETPSKQEPPKTREERIVELEREIAAKNRELGQLVNADSQQKSAVAGAPTAKSTYELAKTWTQGALQLRDDALRAGALEKIRAALAAKDPVESQAALMSLAQIGELSYDKAGMRELVLPYVDANDATTLRAAWYALLNTQTMPGDLDKLIQLEHTAPNQFLDESYTALLSFFAKRDLSGPAGAVVERLLAKVGPGSRRQMLSGLWGAHVTRGIEERLLVLSHDSNRDLAHDAIYFGLSTLNPKSAAVVERLIKVLEDPDPDNSGRALWGLGSGVQPTESALVADAALRLFETREQRGEMQRVLQLLARHGTLAHAEQLEAIAARDGASEAQKTQAKSTAEQIRRRLG